MKGYVYVLSNPAMPDLLKVGRSVKGGKKRAAQLYSGTTGVPTPFVLEYEILCDDYERTEGAAHALLGEYRVSDSREFFRCFVHDAVEAVTRAAMWDYDMELVLPETVIRQDVIFEDIDRKGLSDAPEIRNLHPFMLIDAYQDAIRELDPVQVARAYQEKIDRIKKEREKQPLREVGAD